MSGSKASWLAREGVPSVSLAVRRTPAAAALAWPPVPFLRREDVTLAMEAEIRAIAAIFPGTRLRLEGVLQPLKREK